MPASLGVEPLPGFSLLLLTLDPLDQAADTTAVLKSPAALGEPR